MSIVKNRPSASRGRVRRQFSILAWIVLLLLLAACGGEEATPTPTQTATSLPQATATLTAESTPVDDTVMIEVTLEPTPMESAAETLANTTNSENTANAEVAIETTPVVEEGLQCAVESDLDLAGYPELESMMGCATGAARTDPVGFNEFGPGPDYKRFMLWLSWEMQIYVLFPEGTVQVYPDTWTNDMPEFACNPTPRDPASPPLPRRGFGKVWCENADVRDRMGLIAVEERLCQHAVTQEFEQGRVVACFEDATIRYYRLLNDNTWQAVLQP